MLHDDLHGEAGDGSVHVEVIANRLHHPGRDDDHRPGRPGRRRPAQHDVHDRLAAGTDLGELFAAAEPGARARGEDHEPRTVRRCHVRVPLHSPQLPRSTDVAAASTVAARNCPTTDRSG